MDIAKYGIAIDARQVKAAEAALNGMGVAGAKAEKTLDSMSATLARGVGFAALTVSAKAAATALLSAQIEADRLANTLKFAAGAENFRNELEFTRRTAHDLGLELVSSSQAYAKLAAAAKGTALEGQAARDIFTAVGKASTVMGLSATESQGALLAISQMISKGTVQAEELRGQLGERLPGAFQMAARAMGVTTAELGKMLEQGQVMADDFLPKLAKELERTLGDQAGSAAMSAQAGVNKLNNEWTLLMQSMAGSEAWRNTSGYMLESTTNWIKNLRAALEHGDWFDKLQWLTSGTVSQSAMNAASGKRFIGGIEQIVPPEPAKAAQYKQPELSTQDRQLLDGMRTAQEKAQSQRAELYKLLEQDKISIDMYNSKLAALAEKDAKKSIDSYKSIAKHAADYITTLEKESQELGMNAQQKTLLEASTVAVTLKTEKERQAVMAAAEAHNAKVAAYDAERAALVSLQNATDEAFAEDQKALEANYASIASVRTKIEALEAETYALTHNKEETKENTIMLALQRSGLEATSNEYIELEKRIRAASDAFGDAKRSSDIAKAAEESAKDAARQWERAADQIGQSLADNIMRGGKSAGELLEDYFRTLVLRPMIQGVVQGGMNAVFGTNGGGAGSMLSSLSNLTGVGGFGSLGTMASYGTAAATGGLLGGASQGAMLAAQTAEFGLEGAALTADALGGVASSLGGVSAALGPIGIGLAVLAASGAFSHQGGPKRQFSGGNPLQWAEEGSSVLNPANTATDTAQINQAVAAGISAYSKTAARFGAAGALKLRISGDTDPMGTAPDSVMYQMQLNDQQKVFGKNFGRGEGEANVPEMINRALLEAFQATDMGPIANAIVAGLDPHTITTDLLNQTASALSGASELFGKSLPPIEAAMLETKATADELAVKFKEAGISGAVSADSIKDAVSALDLTDESAKETARSMLSLVSATQAYQNQVDSLDAAMAAVTKSLHDAVSALYVAQGRTADAAGVSMLGAQAGYDKAYADTIEAAAAQFGVGVADIQDVINREGGLQQAAEKYANMLDSAGQEALTRAATYKTQIIGITTQLWDAQLSKVKQIQGWIGQVDAFSKSIDTAKFDILFGLPGADQIGMLKSREADLWAQFNANTAPLSDETVAHQIELASQIKDSILQRYELEAAALEKTSSFIRDIGDFSRALKIGDLSPLTAIEKAVEARRQYSDLMRTLRDPSVTSTAREIAQGKIAGAASDSLKYSKDTAATLIEYRREYARVQADMGSLGADSLTIEEQQAKSLAQLTLKASATVDELKALQAISASSSQWLGEMLKPELAKLATIGDTLAALGVTISGLPNAIAAALQGVSAKSTAYATYSAADIQAHVAGMSDQSVAALYAEAVKYNVNPLDVGSAYGLSASQTTALLHDAGIPGYATGINAGILPSDQIIQAHGGERITPAVYVDEEKASRNETNALMRRLVSSMDALKAENAEMKLALVDIKKTNNRIAIITEKSDTIGPAPARATA